LGVLLKTKKKRAQIEIRDATGAIVHRVYVENPERGLRGADLEGMAAPLAQLQGIDLTEAKLYWASLGDADLSFANFSGADLRGASLDRARCRGTSFERANLSFDNLGGRTILRGADLSTAKLDGCNLTGAVYDDATRFPQGFDPTMARMVHVDDLPPGDPGRI